MKSDLEQLKYMRIVELKEIARKTGVRAPSQLRKSQLAEEITAILSGQKQPFISKVGRPYMPSPIDVGKFTQAKEAIIKVNKEEQIKKARNFVLFLFYTTLIME